MKMAWSGRLPESVLESPMDHTVGTPLIWKFCIHSSGLSYLSAQTFSYPPNLFSPSSW